MTRECAPKQGSRWHMELRDFRCLCSFESTKGPFAAADYPMTPTAEDLKAELLAHACKLPASGPPVRAGRAASAGAELPANFGAAVRGPQQGPQPVLAFPACASCPPEFWGEPPGDLPCIVLPSPSLTLHPALHAACRRQSGRPLPPPCMEPSASRVSSPSPDLE